MKISGEYIKSVNKWKRHFDVVYEYVFPTQFGNTQLHTLNKEGEYIIKYQLPYSELKNYEQS